VCRYHHIIITIIVISSSRSIIIIIISIVGVVNIIIKCCGPSDGLYVSNKKEDCKPHLRLPR
jgi:hypothetical protein